MRPSLRPLLSSLLCLSLGTGLRAQCGGNGGNADLETSPQAIGTTVTLTLRGAPGAPYSIFLGDQPGSLVVPGFGTVCLDVTSPAFTELFTGTVPGTGQLDIPFPIPNDPALLSLVLYLQAIVVDPGHPSGFALSRAVRVDFEAPDAFTTLAPLPAPLALATANLLPDGRVLVAGGGSGSLLSPSGTNQTRLYDPFDRLTSAGPSMSVNRAFHTATTLADGRVLIAGGVADGSGNVTASCEIFDPFTDAVLPAAPMGTTRAAHAAVLLGDGRVLVAGGTTTFATTGGQIGTVLNSSVSSGEVYDPASDSWTPVPNTMQSRRFAPAAGRLPDGRVLIVSGLNGATSFFGVEIPTWTSSCSFFNPATGSFQSAPGIGSFSPVTAAAAAVHPGTGDFLLVGGAASFLGVPTATAQTLVFDGSSWSPGPTLPTAVVLPGAVVQDNGKIHISGGATGDLTNPGAAVDCTAYNGTTLESKAPLPQPRGVQAAAGLKDGGVLLVGGADATGTAVDSVVLYTPDP